MIIGIESTKAIEDEKTGVGYYAYFLIKEMIKQNNGNHILKLYVNPRTISNNQILKIKQRETSPVRVSKLKWPLKRFWTQGRLSLEMLFKKPDVLFIPAHLPPLIYPKKLVVTVHDIAFKQYPEVYSKRELKMQEWGLKKVLKKAWKIITPSAFTKSEILRYYPWADEKKIFVVHHGVEITQNSKLKTENGNSSSPSGKSNLTTLVYIGRLEHKKNVVNLIKSFNILKKNYKLYFIDCRLELIGSPGYGFDEIEQEIAQSPYKHHINRPGYVSRGEMQRRLERATVFVLPSLYEGFGMPALEALASGTPVACSDIPALKEIGQDIPLYFNPHDPLDMAKTIAQFFLNKQAALKRMKQGIARSRLFSWRTAAQKTLNILTENQI